MVGLGVPEMLLILVVVLLLFGLGRVSRLGGELGSSVSAFRKGLKQHDADQVSSDMGN